MGKTVFNPITTKWRGAIGGFRYSVVRGKQVIAERASAVKNPNTVLQRGVRARFKIASQFSALWKDIFAAFLSPFAMDDVLARAEVTKAAFNRTSYDDQTDTVTLTFPVTVSDVSNKHFRSPIFQLGGNFNSGITASGDAQTVIYQINAYDKDGILLGSSQGTLTLVDSQTPVNVPFPLATGTPFRYDVIAYSVTPSTEAAAGALQDILATPAANIYELAGVIKTVENVEVHGLTSISVQES